LRLRVEVGDKVAIGSPVAENKKDPRILFVSPAGGQVVAINRGPRRRIDEIVVEIDPEEEKVVDFPAHSVEEISRGLGRDEIVSSLLNAGLWPLVRQRPYARVASPDSTPQAIFVSAIDTEPLAASPAFLLQKEESSFKVGMKVLSGLTDGKVYLCCPETPSPQLRCLKESDVAEIHTFTGPHPAGSVGTHIHHIEPLRKGQVIWTVKAADVVPIGRFFQEGHFPFERTIAVAGEGAKVRKYFRTRLGVPVETLLASGVENGKQRLIAGTVLTGKQLNPGSFMGYYDTTLTVIPEGGKRTFLGWMLPGFGKSSYSRTFASSLAAKERFEFDTSLNGSLRAIVPIGSYESVMALDIQPTFLFKSIIYGDLEEAEKLGLLECAEEDVALLSYVCHSKIDFCSLLRQGLEQYEKEG
jgi:Na+-transporting NADH:ubiquinone oxidoreductase subunit A